MAKVRTYARHLRDIVQYYAHGLYTQLSAKNVFLWSQAIAFKVLVTIVPVIILATGILGQVLEREKPFDTVATFIRNFVPPDQSESFILFLRRLSSAGDFFTIIGVIGLLFSAVTLFTTLRIAVGNVFQEEWHENRSILGGYVFDMRMVLQVGLLFLLTTALSLAVQTLNTAGFEFIQKVGLDYLWIRVGWRRVFTLLGLVIPFLLTIAMFFQLFYFVPKPHPPRRSVLLGASISAVLWEAAKYGFTLYATHVGRFNRYGGVGGEEGLGKLGDTFGLIIAFVFWVYFSGLVLCLGAIIALLHETRHRSRRLAAMEEQENKRSDDGEESAEEVLLDAAAADGTTTALIGADRAPAEPLAPAASRPIDSPDPNGRSAQPDPPHAHPLAETTKQQKEQKDLPVN